ncbi:MAG: DUF4153 domain-containing protein [Mycobacteriaceae bacterium]
MQEQEPIASRISGSASPPIQQPACVYPQLGAAVPGYVRHPPRLWPSKVWRKDGTSIATLQHIVMALMLGILATQFIDLSSLGIGVPIFGSIVIILIFYTSKKKPTAMQYFLLIQSILLLSICSFRDVLWINVFSIIGAWIIFSYALIGGKTWTALFVSSIVLWLTPVRVLGWLRRGIVRIKGNSRVARGVHPGRVAAVFIATVFMVGIFSMLFSAADAQYGALLGRLAPFEADDNVVSKLVVGLFVAFIALAASYLLIFTPKFDLLAPKKSKALARWEWALPVVMVDLLFLSFVVVQLFTLFGGREYVLKTAGVTYAEHARQGFWQLLAVTILTLVVIAVVIGNADRTNPIDRMYLRIILGTLCLLSLIIVFSALRRMWLYQNEFGFTRLRFIVFSTELWLGLIFILLLIAGMTLRGTQLALSSFLSATIFLVFLALLNPDRVIASHNIERFNQTGKIDEEYLSELSFDAIPVLSNLPESIRSCVLTRSVQKLSKEDGHKWYQFNFSVKKAQMALQSNPIAKCDR